jgi:uncharacterized protein YcnI
MRKYRVQRRGRTTQTLVRTGMVLVAMVAGVAVATPAFAHVTVNPGTASQGGYAKLTFRVPNEKATASTTSVEVNLPTDAPIASVSVKPVPGWTAEATRTALPTPIKTDDGEITEAVTKIVWTATPDAVIKPGQFQEFDVSAGPLPKVDQLVFKALQKYSDGETVAWIEEPKAGVDAQHPAPVLKLNKPADTQQAAVTVSGSPAPSAAAPAASSSSTANAALGIAVAALVLAVAGLALAFVRRRGQGRPRTPDAT